MSQTPNGRDVAPEDHAGEPVRADGWDQSTIRVGPLALSTGLEARRPCVIVHQGGMPGQRHDLLGRSLLVGRSPECGVCLDGLGISRRHAQLSDAAGRCELVDLGSANGTYVNERRVQGPVALAEGDVIRIGPAVLRFHERRGIDTALHERLLQMARIDPVTGAMARRHWMDALQSAYRAARHAGLPLSLVCVDLDHFKSVNDRFGHAAGDVVLRRTVETLGLHLAPAEPLGRLGGEEFAVLLPQAGLAAAVERAEQLRRAIAGQGFEFVALGSAGGAAVPHRQTASLGVAQLDAATPDALSLLNLADQRLYAAKRQGRDRVAS